MNKMTLKDVDLSGKKVLMRVDFNVPLQDGEITNDNRIRQALESINYVISQGATLLLISHLGRPKGKRDPQFSLKPVLNHLKRLVAAKVHFADDCVGSEAQEVISRAEPGEVVLLENLRFHKGETENDPEFSRQLASLGDLYVNDAFGCSHRSHSSVDGITRFMQPCLAGLLLERELRYLSDVVENPDRPFLAVLGGAKVSDKIGVIDRLLDIADQIIVGGGMSYTFFRALNLPVGRSMVEEDKVEVARKLLDKADSVGAEMLFPMDHVVAREYKNDSERDVVGKDGIEQGWMALDIGPRSAQYFGEEIRKANTVFWNGPMGVFEMDNFSKGTYAVAGAMSQASKEGKVCIVGGGDSAYAVSRAGLEADMTHISTGGGASLMLLEGQDLPGVTVLTEKDS